MTVSNTQISGRTIPGAITPGINIYTRRSIYSSRRWTRLLLILMKTEGDWRWRLTRVHNAARALVPRNCAAVMQPSVCDLATTWARSALVRFMRDRFINDRVHIMILKFLSSKETFLKEAEFPSKRRSLIFHKKCMFFTISHSKCFNYQYMSRENFSFRSIHDVYRTITLTFLKLETKMCTLLYSAVANICSMVRIICPIECNR